MCDSNPNIASIVPFYFIFIVIISYILPLIVTMFFYSLVYARIKSTTVVYNLTTCPSNHSYRHINATKMMATATLLFMMSTLPVSVIWIILAVSKQSLIEIILNYNYLYVLTSAGIGFATSNSIQNPIIYAIYNERIRHAMLAVIHCNGLNI